MKLLQSLRRLFRVEEPLDPAELQAAFQQHYKKFRSLLNANNNALELMAEMEEALDSGKTFGMAFIRGSCTALSANVYKMIKNLTALADGRYSSLIPRFREVSARIEAVLGGKPGSGGEGQHILAMDEIDSSFVDQTGEKMANLGEIRNRVGLRTPDGFVITAAAAAYFMASNQLQDEINRRLKSLDEDNLEDLFTVSASVQQLISSAPLPEDLDTLIHEAYNVLAADHGAEVLVSMRSSATGEDGMHVSFAGQYRTQLNVHPEFLARTYKEILAGKYKGQAIVYRMERGYRHQDVAMCVGCLVMVDAVVSGIAYSRHSGDTVSIHAVEGLAASAVDGSAPYELYQVGREQPFSLRGKGGTLLTPDQVQEVARAALRLEEHFGSPQDIEWSYDRTGRLVILQSRPLDSNALQGTEAEGARAGGHPPLLAGEVTASRGAAAGPVYIVRSKLDLLQFPKGAVLVAQVPYPDWAVLVNRAAALICETGQSATHLATVAREFGVPALFGVAGACSRLKNGDMVTVDATTKNMHAGKIDELLQGAAPKPNLMLGSPVHRILKDVLPHITPLNLTDPASAFFAPSSCETLHDFTRYCHEKAVQEMFNFGSRYRFDRRTAKQLVVSAPFQWWVINLDDGFKEGADQSGKFICLDDIQSRPMLAIWHGMTAVPWEGPPPVNLQGLGSIIFQSTMNPRLDPAVRSGMAGKNYFLISRNFCNLSVRLGYHFALVEANLSEFLIENYVSFQFKGGAADERRRFLRINLLAEILQQYNFRVEVTRDALTARLEKCQARYLEDRLAVVGYLLIHTRQIDMVMGDTATLERYRRKIKGDLAELFSGAGELTAKGA
ncbi:MAG: PEP/pyruvate-binding domain-containing protein [Desulfobulbaceae bacterium]